MLIIIGIIYIAYKWIEALCDDAYIQQRYKQIGAEVYRSNFGDLRYTSTGKPLTGNQIREYYNSKRGK